MSHNGKIMINKRLVGRWQNTFMVVVTLLLSTNMLFAQTDEELGLDPNGAWAYVQTARNPNLPNVLLIGDSILNGYGPGVEAALVGTANVESWATGNNLNTATLRTELAYILRHGPYDVVHFNMGLHGWPDGRIPEGQYTPLMELYVAVMLEGTPGAKTIWASTTSISLIGQPSVLDPVYNSVITNRNAEAAAIMQTNGITINDLYTLMVAHLDWKFDQFHYTPTVLTLLTHTIFPTITAAMKGSVVANRGTTITSTNAATLKGSLLTAGQDATAEITLFWGPEDGGMTSTGWLHSVSLGPQLPGPFSLELTTLSPETNYYYRTYSTNSVGEDWAPSSTLFQPFDVSEINPNLLVHWKLDEAS